MTDYGWDHRNRLTSVLEKPSATGAITKRTSYIYDAFDRRTAKRLDSDGDGLMDVQKSSSRLPSGNCRRNLLRAEK